MSVEVKKSSPVQKQEDMLIDVEISFFVIEDDQRSTDLRMGTLVK